MQKNKFKVLTDKNAISLGSKVAFDLKYKPNRKVSSNSNKNAEIVIRLFTVPYFLERSLRYSAS